MIKTSEIREGVWIELKNSGFIKVEVDNIGDIVNNPSIFDPIPLTPEILEQCGFEFSATMLRGEPEENKVWGIQVGNNSYLELHDDEWKVVNEFAHVGAEFWNQPKALHELQSIFFWLGAEELVWQNEKVH